MDDLKKIYGADHPNSVMVLGMRIPLKLDRRFTRHYHSEEQRLGAQVSKFQDGSATITFCQLADEWHQWSYIDRHEFISACNGLHNQSDYGEILRFLMKQDDPDIWRGIALDVAGCLPQDEAFDLLTRALARIESHSANVAQGISVTRHPKAADVLREHLESLWQHPALWDDDQFTNWHAFDAICCIDNLLQLGVPIGECAERARELSNHVCAGTRESCATFLSRHYEWIPKPDPGRLGL